MGRPSSLHDALVLGTVDYGDADRIVRLLTPDHGRLSALARGARVSRRRFGGVLDLGNRLRVGLVPGQGDLWNLTEATLADARLGIRDHLEAMALAGYACEIVGGLCAEGQSEVRMFGLLDTFLVLLEAWEPTREVKRQGRPGTPELPSPLFRMALEAKALTYAGLAPVLDHCIRCGGGIEGPCRFNAASGGALHVECGDGEAVDAAFLAAVEMGRRTRLVDVLPMDCPPGPRWFLACFAEYHLGRPLRSRVWLSTLDGP